MLRTLLIWGLLAGFCGGLLAAGFASVTGEHQVDASIAIEEAKAKAAHEPQEPALVSRDLQKSLGLLTASIVYGLALGGIFAIVFAVAYGRVGRASPATTALLLALGAFVVVYLVPFLKYPANPPATGNPDTIGRRTELYLLMISISVLAAVAASRLRASLRERVDPSVATGLGVALFVLVVVVAGLVMPGVHEIPADFPATVLWNFRLSSIGMQAVLWTTIGLVFAIASQRVMTRAAAGAADRAPSPV
jgi:protein-S-isoprenylcysteine O-methyltransferase Ste14